MVNRQLDVLLVEDDYLDAHITKRFLMQSSSNFQVIHLADGLAAIDYLLRRKSYANATRPDLIVLDMRLPGMTGPEIVRFLNWHEELKKIPVIVISGEIRKVQIDDMDVYPTFVKWLGMKDFKSIVAAAEDILLQRQVIAA